VENDAVTSRVHKLLSSAVLAIGITVAIVGRLRLLWLVPVGRWFFLVYAVAAGVEFFWTALSRSMTRDDRGVRRFVFVLMSIAALVGTSEGATVHWGWWLTILAILWIPQLFPTNRYLHLESRYDKRGPQWRDSLLMAIPAVGVVVGFGLLAHHLHQVQVTEAAHCPHGLYKLVSTDHSSYSCVRTGLH
jgi:hypothetical protein